MWRWSGRGWTVMPWAPASRASRAAPTTLGMLLLRVFRSVATLLTLTLRRVIGPSPSRARSAENGDARELLLQPGDVLFGHLVAAREVQLPQPGEALELLQPLRGDIRRAQVQGVEGQPLEAAQPRVGDLLAAVQRQGPEPRQPLEERQALVGDLRAREAQHLKALKALRALEERQPRVVEIGVGEVKLPEVPQAAEVQNRRPADARGVEVQRAEVGECFREVLEGLVAELLRVVEVQIFERRQHRQRGKSRGADARPAQPEVPEFR